MMFRCRIKLDEGLYEMTKHRAAQLGYASIDEFVTHLLECELARSKEQADEEIVAERLRGLGYIE